MTYPAFHRNRRRFLAWLGLPVLSLAVIACGDLATDPVGLTDNADLTAVAELEVNAPDAINLLEAIVYRLRDLNQMGIIDDAQQQALETPIRAAIPLAKDPVDRLGVIKQMDRFANQVRALRNAGVLSSAEAQNLIDMARAVIQALP